MTDEPDTPAADRLEAKIETIRQQLAQIEELRQDQLDMLGALEHIAATAASTRAATENHEGRLASLEVLWPNADDALTEWVEDWLIPTFALHVLLTGWNEHPGFTSELAALHLAYQHMATPDAHGFDSIAWHSHLASMTNRLEELKRRINTQTSDATSDSRLSKLLQPRQT